MHPNKHIRTALKYASKQGWKVKKSKGHSWGIIYCSHGHNECRMSVYSTPKNPEAHAKDIRRVVDGCPHATT